MEDEPIQEQCPDVSLLAGPVRVMGVLWSEYRRLSVAYHREGMEFEADLLAQAAERLGRVHLRLAHIAGRGYPDAPDHIPTDSPESTSTSRES